MIAVYGATGYTGRLVARELRRRGLSATLSGRDAGKLRALAEELEVDWPIRAAAVDDAPGLRRALLGAQAVINCAGPFTFYGAPVIEAALDVGAQYCDTTGEQRYMDLVLRHVDAPARARGVAVVPGAGFDFVPGDLACALAARGIEPLRELVVAYSVKGFGATRGTLHSALEILRAGDLEYAGGDWRPAGRPPLFERFPFPEPVGEQPVMRLPGGEVLTAPRHVRTRAVRERMNAAGLAPHPVLKPAIPVLTAVLSPVIRSPLRGALDALIDRLPEGPGDQARRASAFMVVAEAHGEDGARGRAVVTGTDVYGLTAVIAVEIARRMAADGFSGVGVLAPAQAVAAGEFLGFLGEHGVSHRVDAPVPAGDPARA